MFGVSGLFFMRKNTVQFIDVKEDARKSKREQQTERVETNERKKIQIIDVTIII